MDTIRSLVTRGRELPVKLDRLPQLEAKLSTAESWLEQTSKAFLLKKSQSTLLEVPSVTLCRFLFYFHHD